MNWQDEAIVLSVRPHGETAAVVELFTRAHGRHMGLVHGGRSRKSRPVLQTGNHVDASWKGRLSESLGHMALELRTHYAAAQARLNAAGVANARLLTGDAVHDWAPQEKFDAIVVTGAVWQVPPRFLGWLKPGGRLLAIRGESPAQQAVLLTQTGAGGYREDYLFETDLPYLVGAEPPRRFVF